jgi:reactive intermediate/imine deaminase
MLRQAVHTAKAPKAIGTYSQAVRAGSLLFISGQIALDPQSMELINGDIDAELTRVFDNLAAVAEAAGGTLNQAVQVVIFLTDLSHFPKVNQVMATHFREPYPSRAAVGVRELPRGARVEIQCVLHLE